MHTCHLSIVVNQLSSGPIDLLVIWAGRLTHNASKRAAVKIAWRFDSFRWAFADTRAANPQRNGKTYSYFIYITALHLNDNTHRLWLLPWFPIPDLEQRYVAWAGNNGLLFCSDEQLLAWLAPNGSWWQLKLSVATTANDHALLRSIEPTYGSMCIAWCYCLTLIGLHVGHR